MKLTDGLFHRVFESIAADYPELESEHQIIDIGAARLATSPRDFDVIVTLNLYGDILSDIAAQVAGSVGLAGSANIGHERAMFEAVHGSAPTLAGKNLANPTGLLLAAVMMLAHLGRRGPAEAIHNALLCTLEDGLHTADVFDQAISRRQVGTREFAHAIIERLGRQPRQLKPADYPETPSMRVVETKREARANKAWVGTDVFLDWSADGRDPNALARRLEPLAGPDFRLSLITNRGVKVWPQSMPDTLCTDHWRCRFLGAANVGPAALPRLLMRLHDAGFDVIKTENLYSFDGVKGYSAGQGE